MWKPKLFVVEHIGVKAWVFNGTRWAPPDYALTFRSSTW